MEKLTPKRKFWHNLLFTHVIPAARDLSLDLSLLKLCDNLSCILLKILSNLIYAYAYSNIHFTVLLHQCQMPLVAQLFENDYNVSFECFELSASTNDTSKQKQLQYGFRRLKMHSCQIPSVDIVTSHFLFIKTE